MYFLKGKVRIYGIFSFLGGKNATIFHESSVKSVFLTG